MVFLGGGAVTYERGTPAQVEERFTAMLEDIKNEHNSVAVSDFFFFIALGPRVE